MFEATLPSMFEGVSQHAGMASRTNEQKDELGEAVMQELHELNALDREFYRCENSETTLEPPCDTDLLITTVHVSDVFMPA